MSNVYEPTEEQAALWDAFVASRPDNVRAVAEKFKPWKLYRMNSGHRVTLYSFGEQVDGTVTLTVKVTGEFNMVIFNRQVFGINPDDLVECELPPADEILGTMMEPADVDAVMDFLRVTARPDLFEMDANGKVVRKDGPISDSE